ncbi:hypothetical protein K450DRAFT_263584 [Umbelopsis ramanniana AG]|uniref:Uncharacterized protein n=1 Tax=Umbelopsis ramanniana AG TaxID=1314678 RepID=A0AAD5E170_UMBRA|nr:uncharacterized protein K450DRAFT_263584 [Umbelopsis ramanniana AG]KAI8575044.1 hypothetical protein K450DRAFT_263584 [Umbelopsis ramanniana AG]
MFDSVCFICFGLIGFANASIQENAATCLHLGNLFFDHNNIVGNQSGFNLFRRYGINNRACEKERSLGVELAHTSKCFLAILLSSDMLLLSSFNIVAYQKNHPLLAIFFR